MKLFASAALLIVVAGVGSATASQGRGHPSSFPKTLPTLCGLPDVEGAIVEFKAGDGANLVGAVAGRSGGRVGVVLANPGGGEICNEVASPRTNFSSRDREDSTGDSTGSQISHLSHLAQRLVEPNRDGNSLQNGRAGLETCGHLRVRERPQEDSSSQGASNLHGCVTLRGGVQPLDATNGHGNLPRNLPIHRSQRRSRRGPLRPS